MVEKSIRSARPLAAVILVGLVLAAVACGSDKPQTRAPKAGGAAPGVRQFEEAHLPGLLLPAKSLPAGMVSVADFLLSNQDVAQFFPDPEHALRSMVESGRGHGAFAEYHLDGAPGATEQALQVASSTSWYQTVAGAQAVMRDPTVELVIHQLGLRSSEISKERVGEESRVFRGFRERDGPNWVAYMVLFRRQNVIGAVVAVVPNTNDDGGRLAMSLARRQAAVSVRGTTPSGTALK